MDPAAFLAVAASLRNSQEEAELRTSVSRSYYALLNVVRTGIVDVGVVIDPTTDSHGQVAHRLVKSNNRDLASIGQTLQNLRLKRNEADYDMSCDLTQRATEGVYKRADSAVAKFRGLSNIGPWVHSAGRYEPRRR